MEKLQRKLGAKVALHDKGGSGTLEIRYQVFNYVAFLVRYGQSIAIGQGTGYAAPKGALGGGTIEY